MDVSVILSFMIAKFILSLQLFSRVSDATSAVVRRQLILRKCGKFLPASRLRTVLASKNEAEKER